MSEDKPQETKIDKRKISSKNNLAKARQVKLDKLKQKKEVQKYEIQSESESSDSDEEVIVVQSKKRKQIPKKTKEVPADDLKERLLRIEQQNQQLIEKYDNLVIKTKKRKPKNAKQVIKIVNPPAVTQSKSSPEVDTLKKRMLLNF